MEELLERIIHQPTRISPTLRSLCLFGEACACSGYNKAGCPRSFTYHQSKSCKKNGSHNLQSKRCTWS